MNWIVFALNAWVLLGLEVGLKDTLRIGELLGRTAEAARLVSEMQSVLDARPVADFHPRVLVEWWPRPVIVPGAPSWVTQQLLAAGGVNPMGERPVESSPITDEEARAQPCPRVRRRGRRRRRCPGGARAD